MRDRYCETTIAGTIATLVIISFGFLLVTNNHINKIKSLKSEINTIVYLTVTVCDTVIIERISMVKHDSLQMVIDSLEKIKPDTVKIGQLNFKPITQIPLIRFEQIERSPEAVKIIEHTEIKVVKKEDVKLKIFFTAWCLGFGYTGGYGLL